MKSPKKFKSRRLSAIIVLGLILSLNVADLSAGDWFRPDHGRRHHKGGSSNSVGAPLDGGLITILLGGAGIAYFNKRRKKNNEQ